MPCCVHGVQTNAAATLHLSWRCRRTLPRCRQECKLSVHEKLHVATRLWEPLASFLFCYMHACTHTRTHIHTCDCILIMLVVQSNRSYDLCTALIANVNPCQNDIRPEMSRISAFMCVHGQSRLLVVEL